MIQNLKLCFVNVKFFSLFQVDYDRTKHLTDACVKKRKDERERLVAQDKELQERMRLQNEKEMENDAILRLKEKWVFFVFKDYLFYLCYWNKF